MDPGSAPLTRLVRDDGVFLSYVCWGEAYFAAGEVLSTQSSS
jgi:hypothetical protein